MARHFLPWGLNVRFQGVGVCEAAFDLLWVHIEDFVESGSLFLALFLLGRIFGLLCRQCLGILGG